MGGIVVRECFARFFVRRFGWNKRLVVVSVRRSMMYCVANDHVADLACLRKVGRSRESTDMPML